MCQNGRSAAWGAPHHRALVALGRIWRLTPDSRAPAKQSWHHVGPMLGLCWPMLAYVGPCWAVFGAMLGPCLGHLCWHDLKMPIFLPRATSWSPTPRENRCFSTSPRWNSLPPKGSKHRKKRCFFNTTSKIHRKLQGLQWFGRPGVGGRAGSALPPKASGKDTRWPVAGVRI